MQLKNTHAALESATTYDARERIRAGVRPGLQNLRHGCSRPRVAQRERAAAIARRDGYASADGQVKPDRTAREESRDVANPVAQLTAADRASHLLLALLVAMSIAQACGFAPWQVMP